MLAAAEQLWLGLKSKSFGAVLDAQPQQSLPAGAVLVEAENYQRGNVLKSKSGYGEGIGVILNPFSYRTSPSTTSSCRKQAGISLRFAMPLLPRGQCNSR